MIPKSEFSTGETTRPTEHCTKMTFSIKDFFSKYDQIRRKLRIWSHWKLHFLCSEFSEVNWQIHCADLKIHITDWLKNTEMVEWPLNITLAIKESSKVEDDQMNIAVKNQIYLGTHNTSLRTDCLMWSHEAIVSLSPRLIASIIRHVKRTDMQTN